MNLLHMKYAVEIAEAKSINRASETLFVGQPTLSRAIKELEQNLGIRIFDRSAKGMFLTPDGEVFIRYAKAILKQVDEVEAAFRRSGTRRQRFSLSCPRASYISDAFTAFSLLFKPSDAIDAFYYETNSANTVKMSCRRIIASALYAMLRNMTSTIRTCLKKRISPMNS